MDCRIHCLFFPPPCKSVTALNVLYLDIFVGCGIWGCSILVFKGVKDVKGDDAGFLSPSCISVMLYIYTLWLHAAEDIYGGHKQSRKFRKFPKPHRLFVTGLCIRHSFGPNFFSSLPHSLSSVPDSLIIYSHAAPSSRSLARWESSSSREWVSSGVLQCLVCCAFPIVPHKTLLDFSCSPFLF